MRCVTFQMRELGKAQAMGELPGFFKLVAATDSGRLLGAHIAGAHASDLVAEAALALGLLAVHLVLGEGRSLQGLAVDSVRIRNVWLDGLHFFLICTCMG